MMYLMMTMIKDSPEERQHDLRKHHAGDPEGFGHHFGRHIWQQAPEHDGNNNNQATRRQEYVQHRKGDSELVDDYLAYFGLER